MPSTELLPDAPFFIVLNAGSGHSETEMRISTINEVMDAGGRVCHLEVVDEPERIEQIAKDMAAKAVASGGVLVAAGGDGTINTVAHQAVLAGCAFGVLPQGTFNYFSRTHGIPAENEAALQVLLNEPPRAVQVGLVNDKVFLVNASMGLYAELLEEREAYKSRFGRSRLIAFGAGLMTVLRGHRHWKLRMAWHGKERDIKTPTLFVGNNALQMQQVGIPEADALEQGQLAAIALKPVGPLAMPGLLIRGALGKLGGAEHVLSFPFQSMTVKGSARRVKVATDGEIGWLDMPLLFRVSPEPLWLIRPDVAPELEAAKE